MNRALWPSTVIGLATGWIAFCLVVWLYGCSPRAMAVLVFEGTWGTSYGAGQVLFKATPLLFTGLAFDMGLRAGLVNIGGEGQLALGSLAAGVVGAHLPANTPMFAALPVALGAAMAAGAIWALIPAVLKVRYGAHEIISTMMLNSVASSVIGLALGAGGLALVGTVRTADIVHGARLPRLDVVFEGFTGSAASFAPLVGLLVAFAVTASYRRTRFGREISLIGANPVAMRAENVPVDSRLGQALVASGALAGAASLGTVLGYKGYFEEGLGSGAGFVGIAVAILGRGTFVGLIFAALLFGTLQQGGLAVNAFVPKELMDILTGVVVCGVALADRRFSRLSKGAA